MRNKGLIVLFLATVSLVLNGQEYQLAKPLVKVEGGSFFEKRARVVLDFKLEGAEVRFTLDGSEPNESSPLYENPIGIKKSSKLKIKAFKNGFLPSETVRTELIKLGKKIKAIEISPQPSKSYPGNGAATLIDRKSGSLNFRDGNWLGYNFGPVTVTIDLGKKKGIQEIILSTLTSTGAWIMPPHAIQSFFSKDGKTFEEGQTLTIISPKDHTSGGKSYYKVQNEAGKVRYVKLVIQPLKALPEWHPGKGNPAWVFLDEIIIK